ncbi:LCP family protein required for cell wall assembly [Clostridiales Family XIII bacterium PM5-7]
MRSNRNSNKKTQDFSQMKYSPELIRQLENPEFAKEADKYEKQARKRKKHGTNGVSTDYVAPTGDGGRRKKQKKYKLNKFKLLRNLLILIIILAVAFTAVFFALTGNFDKIDTKNANFSISSKADEELSGYRNIAILGVDARADEGYDGSRTDAIIIMSIKKSNGDIRLISVMRDSYLKMGYFDDEQILDKITHAHHYAGGLNTVAALNRSMDLNIEEFVIFNWKAVSDTVDCFGGVEVYVKSNEIADMNKYGYETAKNVGGTYKKITQKGKQTLDGVQATTYCRIRKTSGGDAGRGQRYKKIVAAVMKKAITQPWKLSELSQTVFPNIRTNMSQMDMFTAVLRAPGYDIKSSISWPKKYYAGLLSDGISYVVPITLESEVVSLHKKAFGQNNYTVSDICGQINQEIINNTGIQ